MLKTIAKKAKKSCELSFGVAPVWSAADFDEQRHLERMRLFHLALYDSSHVGQLFGRRFEQELIVDLEQQRGLMSRLDERAIDPYHGELDQIGRRALQRGIDGGPLGEATGVRIAAVEGCDRNKAGRLHAR